jgi:hypothetical protein
MRTTFDVVDGALWYSVQHPHGARVAKAWADVKNAAESPVQAWGCWLPGYEWRALPWVSTAPLYWIGARCALGCHAIEQVFTEDVMTDAAYLDGMFKALASRMVAEVALAHAHVS